jgi:predicted ATPase
LVLVPGEAGIGKTTLVRMLRAALRGRTAMAVAGCEPLSVPEPLGPFRDLSAVIPGSSGPCVRAARHSGEQATRDALLESVVPYRQSHGSYRIANVFRFTRATRPAGR